MTLTCICNNCKATINYDESDVNIQIDYIQSEPITTGHIIKWYLNNFKKVKKYYIICPQCKKETMCGMEILGEYISL